MAEVTVFGNYHINLVVFILIDFDSSTKFQTILSISAKK